MTDFEGSTYKWTISKFFIGEEAWIIKKIHRDQFEGAEITNLYNGIADISINDGTVFLIILKFQL